MPAIDLSTDSDQLEEISHLEQIYDGEELAHNLEYSGLFPYDHPRVEALYRRAASGNGRHAQMLRASGMI
ncbi:hypothetical protein [Bradyrhizobium genosp. A]|uniref:hypothetical protein n=1 Tax=Bradyrhizobium genosp. A TaxID=83626 RepID=UPI003CF7E865